MAISKYKVYTKDYNSENEDINEQIIEINDSVDDVESYLSSKFLPLAVISYELIQDSL